MNRDMRYILGFSIITVFLVFLTIYELNNTNIKTSISQTTSPIAAAGVTVIKEASIDNGKITCYYTENDKFSNVLNCVKNW